MNILRVRDVSISHREIAQRYRLGSAPASTRSAEEIRDELMAGICYEVRPASSSDVAYISFVSMARETSGVWLMESLAPVGADISYWGEILHASAQEHISTQLTSRIVQKFSSEQHARSEATKQLGWFFEGVLLNYYRIRAKPANAEQWSLMRESVK